MTRLKFAGRNAVRAETANRRKNRLARAALVWFDEHQRELPWRRNKTRYRVWISEVMLQQTQVTTVIPYFRRFLSKFPTVKSLAKASESDVLRAWEGLGYYRRAQQLHQAAKIIVARHAGRCPEELEDWLALPGVGRYTAGAILSICDDHRLPILEGNTVRLHSRLLGLRDDPRSTASQQRLWANAEDILPPRRVGDFNQALMEIGSQVCVPRNPNCEICPLRLDCVARQLGQVHLIPLRRLRPKPTNVRQVAVFIRRGNRVLMRQCQQGQHWSGLWDVARFDLANVRRTADIPTLIKNETGLEVTLGPPEFAMRHGVTRFKIDMRCHAATQVEGRLRMRANSHWAWIPIGQLTRLPLHATARRIVQTLLPEIRVPRAS